jgi:hypothetical protein
MCAETSALVLKTTWPAPVVLNGQMPLFDVGIPHGVWVTSTTALFAAVQLSATARG